MLTTHNGCDVSLTTLGSRGLFSPGVVAFGRLLIECSSQFTRSTLCELQEAALVSGPRA